MRGRIKMDNWTPFEFIGVFIWLDHLESYTLCQYITWLIGQNVFFYMRRKHKKNWNQRLVYIMQQRSYSYSNHGQYNGIIWYDLSFSKTLRTSEMTSIHQWYLFKLTDKLELHYWTNVHKKVVTRLAVY